MMGIIIHLIRVIKGVVTVVGNSNLLGKYDWYVSIFGVRTISELVLELYTGDLVKVRRDSYIHYEMVGKSHETLTQNKQLLLLLNNLLVEGYKHVLIKDVYGRSYEYSYKRGELENKNKKLNKANFYTKLNQISYLEVVYASGINAFAVNNHGFWYNPKYGKPVDIDVMLMGNIKSVYCTELNGKKHTFNYK